MSAADVLARGALAAGRVDGCFARIVAGVGDVGPAGRRGGTARDGDDLDVWHLGRVEVVAEDARC